MHRIVPLRRPLSESTVATSLDLGSHAHVNIGEPGCDMGLDAGCVNAFKNLTLPCIAVNSIEKP